MKVNNTTLVNAWNDKIREEIIKLYSVRANMILLLKHNGGVEHILEPEMQTVIEKLESLIQ